MLFAPLAMPLAKALPTPKRTPDFGVLTLREMAQRIPNPRVLAEEFAFANWKIGSTITVQRPTKLTS